jgi:hypothetical protein
LFLGNNCSSSVSCVAEVCLQDINFPMKWVIESLVWLVYHGYTFRVENQPGLVSQKIELFISTAVRTSNPPRHEDMSGRGGIDEWSASRPLGNRPRYPLDRRLGGPQSRSGRCEVEKYLLPV